MSEMSDMFKLVNAMELAKKARVGMELTYFDVIELLGEINSLYEYIDELKSAQRWVPVSERLPEIGIRVLTSDVTGYISTDFIVELDMSLCTFHLQRKLVTHWMPLPQPPEVQQ